MSLIFNVRINFKKCISSVSNKSINTNANINANARRSISSSKLTIEKTTDTSRYENKPKNEDLQFGQTISDHMLMVEWDKENKWNAPRIVPYQDLKISPAASCINYGACGNTHG